MWNKIFCGNGKTRTSQFWDFYTLGLKMSELEKYCNEAGYVNIVVNKRKEADKFWNDLSVAINEYKPKDTNTNTWEGISVEDLPF